MTADWKQDLEAFAALSAEKFVYRHDYSIIVDKI